MGISLIVFGVGILAYLATTSKSSGRLHAHHFKVKLKCGHADVRITFRYGDGDDEFLHDAERLMQEWAIALDNPEEGSALNRSLRNHLRGGGLKSYVPNPIVQISNQA